MADCHESIEYGGGGIYTTTGKILCLILIALALTLFWMMAGWVVIFPTVLIIALFLMLRTMV